ncbi:MAG: hypothetical protein K0S46_144 [Moraxellaceae bacterium]|jgi:hypothetical protein|nr:hypothetical protein [Moraxellaceae bacterium]
MAIDDLQQCLPALLNKLSASERDMLLALVDRARAARAREHEVAIEAAVAQVPALLRSTLRRMLTD